MSKLDEFVNGLENEPKKATCFLTVSKFLEEAGIKGVKRIEYSKNPISTYTTSEGVTKTVKGIVLMDANKNQLIRLGVSDRLSKHDVNEVSQMFGACRVRKDTVEVQNEQNETVKNVYWTLCSPGETELAGEGAEVNF